tara:strand:+ start:137 stop:271 length:135 start_codon:yes stop_codon:yes gene_type:complete
MKLGWKKCFDCETFFDWWHELQCDVTLDENATKVVCQLCRGDEE